MVVRVQAQDLSWVWLYMVLQLQSGDIPIRSNNYVIRYSLLSSTSHPLDAATDAREANTKLRLKFVLFCSQ